MHSISLCVENLQDFQHSEIALLLRAEARRLRVAISDISIDWGIARSLRSLSRISENTNIPAALTADSCHQLKTDGIFVFNKRGIEKWIMFGCIH